MKKVCEGAGCDCCAQNAVTHEPKPCTCCHENTTTPAISENTAEGHECHSSCCSDEDGDDGGCDDEDSCACCSGDEPEEPIPFWRIGAGILAYAAALILPVFIELNIFVSLALFAAAWLLIGLDVVKATLSDFKRGKFFTENSLMTIATLGAFAIQEYPEAVAIMLFYQVGEQLQGFAVRRSRKNIKSLMDIRPDSAAVVTASGVMTVPAETVKKGDYVRVLPGERLPLDGKIVEGTSSLNTSALTGESLPRDVSAGDAVLSGSINLSGVLTIEVTKVFAESTISKILELTQNAQAKKAPTEKLITKLAAVYTPIVTGTAFLLAVIPPLFISGAQWSDWVYRGLLFLVASCPCALVISIPLGIFGGIGAASRGGTLVKGGQYLEALADVDTIAFDKTGTLTEGSFTVSAYCAAVENVDLPTLSAHAEYYSKHPLGQSITAAYKEGVDPNRIQSFKEVAGQGVSVLLDGKKVLAGSVNWLKDNGIQATNTSSVAVHFACDGEYVGHIELTDQIRPQSKGALTALKALGVKRLSMLTGDNRLPAAKVAKDLGIDDVHAELLPAHKLEVIEKLKLSKVSKGIVMFVGDGINDAPVLAGADIGVAMGGIGSDAAIDAADVVLMTDNPEGIVRAIQTARFTKRVVWQNIVFAMGIKLLVLVLGAFGVATMWEAVFADVGVALLALLNAMRIMRK